MAADGDCPSQFLGQPWSVWTEHLGRDSPISDEEEPDNKPHADAMRLPREDMGLFGHCPERDPFYAVVCEFCNALVKPQGLRHHMDIWHKVSTLEAVPPAESSEKAIKCAIVPKSGPNTKPNSTNVKLKIKKPVANNTPPSVPIERLLSSNQDGNNVLPSCGNNILPADGLVALTKEGEKILLQTDNSIGIARNQTVTGGPVSLQPVVALTPLSSANEFATIVSILPRLAFQAITGTLNNSTSVTNSHNHSMNVVPGEQLNHSSQRLPGSPQKKRLKSDRMPIKEREYDPDKHCGVWNEESNKPCTRSLTCKTHSMSMRRAVTGRSKHFDKLLADHRAAKEAAGKLGKALGIVQVSTLVDGDGSQLLSPVSVSTNAVPVTELPPSCVVSLPTSLPLSPEGQVNGVQTTGSVPHSPAFPHSALPRHPTVPDLSVDSFKPLSSPSSPPSKPVLASVAQFTPSSCHLPRPPEELATLKFIPKLEEVTWLRSHPKPITVCSFSSRKLGGVVANNRRVELFCHGLKTALTQGCIRFPKSILRTAKDKVLAVRHKPVVAKRVVFHS